MRHSLLELLFQLLIDSSQLSNLQVLHDAHADGIIDIIRTLFTSIAGHCLVGGVEGQRDVHSRGQTTNVPRPGTVGVVEQGTGCIRNLDGAWSMIESVFVAMYDGHMGRIGRRGAMVGVPASARS